MQTFQPGDLVRVTDAHGQEVATVVNETVHGDYWIKSKRTGRECTAPVSTLRPTCGAETSDGNRDDPSYAYCGLPPGHAGDHGEWQK